MPRSRLAPAMLAATAVLAFVQACSTTTAPQQSTSTAATTTTSAPPQTHGVYEQCLTQHGVPSPAAGPAPGPGPVPQGPLPGPAEGTPATTPPPAGVDQTIWDNAMKACASLQPTTPSTGP